MPGLAYRAARRAEAQADDLAHKLQLYEAELYRLRLQLQEGQRSSLPQPAAPTPVFGAVAPMFASPAVAAAAEPLSPPPPTVRSEELTAAAPLPDLESPPLTAPPASLPVDAAATPAQQLAAPADAAIVPATAAATPPELSALAPPSAATPVPTPAPPATSEPAEEGKAFDLEKFIGVRGAAWLGAIALAIAGTLFAKYSIENNLIPPALRIAFLILMGLVALVGSEVFFRPRYPATASPVCGAGVAILYAAFFAGHSAYDLFSLPLTFALMALTTLVAGLLSLRYDSVFIAVLGLLGGFATPLLLSSGKDRPIGLFSYILLLDLGFLAISVQKRWHRVVWLSFFATVLLEVAWAAKHLSPSKLPIALAVFLLFGILYFLLPSLAGRLLPTRDKDAADPEAGPDRQPNTPDAAPRPQQLLQLSVVAGLAPLLFGLVIAGQRVYHDKWPLLLGYLGLLSAALIFVGVRRGQSFLATAAAWAVFLSVGLQLEARPSGAEPLPAWAFSLSILGLTGLLNAAGRVHDWFGPAGAAVGPDQPDLAVGTGAVPDSSMRRLLVEGAGYVGLLGLLCYVVYFSALAAESFSVGLSGHGDPFWPAALLCLSALLLLAERSREAAGRLSLAAPVFAALLSGTTLLALLLQTGRSVLADPQAMPPDRFLRGLSLPLLLAVLAGLLAALRARTQTRKPRAAQVSELVAATLAALSAAAVILLSATGPAMLLPLTPGLGLAFVALYGVLLYLSALRRDYTFLLPLVVALACGEAFALVSEYHHRGDEGSFLPGLAAYVLTLIAAPLALLWLRPSFRPRRGPYLASALAGPALFLPILTLVTDAVGKRAIGLLPLGFALLAVLGLAVVQRLALLPLDPASAAGFPEEVRRRRSLGNQALFAACALGFVAVAIPLQLDRQWIIVAWALEAAAVWWLYRRLPHIGLKYFGIALFAAVLLRLYPDAAFRHLHERGAIVFNWLLYTYGVPAACFLVGARGLSAVEVTYRSAWEERLPVGGTRLAWYQLAYLIGLLSVFVLINLEIADAFSSGRYVEFSWDHSYARDLTVSLAWGLYGLLLLSIGMWQKSRALRFVSLGFMLLTIAKVFLYDLSNIHGIYRPLSFLGLAVSLIVVSLLYQRFVFQREPETAKQSPGQKGPGRPAELPIQKS